MKSLTLRTALVALAIAGFAKNTFSSDPPATAAQIDQVRKEVDGVDKSVGGLADAIKNKSEDQTRTLEQIRGALSQIRSGVDNIDARVPVDGFPIKLPEITNRLENVDALVQRLDADLKKNNAAIAAATSVSVDKLTRIADSLALIERQVAALDASLGQLRSSLSTGLAHKGEAPVEENSPWVPILGSAALFAIAAAIAALIILRAQKARSEADRDSISVMIAQARDQLQETVNDGLKASSSELGRTLTGRELDSGGILKQMQQLVEKVEILGILEKGEKPQAPRSAVPFDERPTIKGYVPPGPSVASAALWPAAFLDPAAPISRWREMLEGNIASAQGSALPVLATWLAVRAAVERPDISIPLIGDSVAAFSASCYAYWESAQGFGEDDRQKANTDWAQALRTYLGPLVPKIEVREILPGVRFDSALMQTVKEGPGNHLNVAEVHSWAVLDRSSDRPKVLNRARITTT